jgi:hypothetical protein
VTDVDSGPPGAGVSRRALLGISGSLAVAASAGALAGCSEDGTRRAGGTSVSGAGASAGQVRRFRSRPDLQPVSAVVRTDRGATAPGLIFVTPSHNRYGQQGPMILDNDGELVWLKPLSDHTTTQLRASNLRVQHYRGQKVLTWFEGALLSTGHGQGRYAIADSSYRILRWVEAGNGYQGDLHEFLITDHGTALFTCYAEGHADLSGAGGSPQGSYFNSVVQEVDIASGRVLFQWRADRHVNFAESYNPAPSDGQNPWDPYHVNSISVAPDGNLLVSARNTWTVYKVERPSGRILWRLGGKKSDFAVSPAARFAWQHHATPHPGSRLAIFDNERGTTTVGNQSRGLMLSVDESRRAVTLDHEYLHGNPPVQSLALGSVQVLPDGHVFVGWGDGPYVTEYHPDGTVIYDLRMNGNETRSYRGFRSPWTGRPAGKPALAVDKVSGGMKLYVSWNGDTEVRHWRILLGSSSGRLAAASVAARHGFETVIKVRRRARYAAVAGLDRSGRELGRSPVHAVQ